jgi:cytochrome c556
MNFNISRGLKVAGGTLLLGAVVSIAAAQAPGGGMAGGGMGAGQVEKPPAEAAIEYRQALYKVIGANFTPVGAVLQGRAEFNGADMLKRAERTAQLAVMLDDAFPEISKTGNTKALPEIWTNRAKFDAIAKDFVTHSAALVAVLKKDSSSATAEFKAAATAVAGDCRNCHMEFRAR